MWQRCCRRKKWLLSTLFRDLMFMPKSMTWPFCRSILFSILFCSIQVYYTRKVLCTRRLCENQRCSGDSFCIFLWKCSERRKLSVKKGQFAFGTNKKSACRKLLTTRDGTILSSFQPFEVEAEKEEASLSIQIFFFGIWRLRSFYKQISK